MGNTGNRPNLDRVAAVVLAGGQGTRLFPLTQHRCKPAVGFGGRYRLIDVPISNALNSRIQTIFVISQYFASQLNQHIVSTYRPELFQEGKIELLCPEESPYKKAWFEGTADAVRQNIEHLLGSSADYFLILSGDQLYNIDFEKLIQFARDSQADLVVASLQVNEMDAKRMGVIKADAQGHIDGFVEKPKDAMILQRFALRKGAQVSYLASMGIYVFTRKALEKLLQEDGVDFGHHLIPKQVAKGKAYAFEYNGYWVDIGTIESFYQANMALIEGKSCLNTYDELNPIFSKPMNLPSPVIQNTRVEKSLISQGSLIECDEISFSVIGARSHVKKGAKIRRSILMGNLFYQAPAHQGHLPTQFSIGENSLVEQAIIDEHCRVGDNVILTNPKKVQSWEGDGIYIRDGVIIVPAGVDLPNNYNLALRLEETAGAALTGHTS